MFLLILSIQSLECIFGIYLKIYEVCLECFTQNFRVAESSKMSFFLINWKRIEGNYIFLLWTIYCHGAKMWNTCTKFRSHCFVIACSTVVLSLCGIVKHKFQSSNIICINFMHMGFNNGKFSRTNGTFKIIYRVVHLAYFIVF